MDKRKPYEDLDRHFSHLPLPDEDQAWEKMAALLDKEEDKDRFIFLPPFLQGCAGWALFLLVVLLAALGVYWARPFAGNQPTPTATPHTHAEPSANPLPGTGQTTTTTPHQHALDQPHRSAADSPLIRKDAGTPVPGMSTLRSAKEQEEGRDAGTKRVHHKEPKTPSPAVARVSRKPVEAPDIAPSTEHRAAPSQETGNERPTPALPATAQDSTRPLTGPAADSVGRPQPSDSLQATPALKAPRKKNHSFAVGLSLQQQVPLHGEKAVPNNYLGRKGSLADYLPSLYLRWYREPKWFLQAEFKYGAPQYTREFVYNQQYLKDSAGAVRTTTSYRLKKTYYHKLPLSVNYRITPRWSVGLGGVYNRFYGAISEKEVWDRTFLFGDTLVSKGIVSDKSDTLFRRTSFQLLLETQYRWKRFSAGARFTQGLSPFIRYTDSQGRPKKEHNHSFSVFLRYELWRSSRR